MKNLFIKNAVLMMFVLTAVPVFARDISHEQQAAYDAREHYSDAVSDYESSGKKVEAQKKLLEREQAKLKELQDNQIAAQKEVDNAKADMDAKSKILDEAWEQRDK
ncbi:MAG: hypothetical protein ACKVOA_03040 [Methylophilaceae bacterium]